MYLALLALGFLGLATAAPSNPSLVARDSTCAPQPTGAGPVPSHDTADNFVNGPVPANSVGALDNPPGYTMVLGRLHRAASGAGYLGFSLMSSFDPKICAAKCNNRAGCQSFNIFMERAPSVQPDAPSCQNPPSQTYYKCSLWSVPIYEGDCWNKGQFRGKFEVVIAASYGYNKLVPNVPVTRQGKPGTWKGSWAIQTVGDGRVVAGSGALNFTLNGPATVTALTPLDYEPLDNGDQYWLNSATKTNSIARTSGCHMYLSGYDIALYADPPPGLSFGFQPLAIANFTATCPAGVQGATLDVGNIYVTRGGNNEFIETL